MPCHHRPPPPKTAPSNKQNDNVAILARVPAISSVFFLFFVCLCQNTCPPPHLASIDNKKKTRATWARHLCFLPVDYQTTKSSRGFFISERCWIAINLLSNTILPALFFCSLSITYTTFYFKTLCHPSEIPLKASFYALLGNTCYHYLGGCILSHFLLSSSHFTLHSEKKPIFEFKLTCN